MFELTELESFQSAYSDMFKDVHGFRPRFPSEEQWNSIEWLKAELDVLDVEMEKVIAQDKIREAEAVAHFEVILAAAVTAGAPDKVTALRWLREAENDDYMLHDDGYFEYSYDLPYGYLKGIA